MSERDAQVAATPGPSRVAEMGRAITRGIKNVAETTNGPSFAASLASASQTVQSDAPTDGTITHGGHRAGQAPLAGAEFGPHGRRDRATGSSPTGAFEPAAAGLTASQPASSRPPAVTAIRPDGRALGSTPAVASTASTASPAASASSATAQTTAVTPRAPSSAQQQQPTAPAAQPPQPYVAAATAAPSQPVSPTTASPAPGSLTYANVGPPGPGTSVPTTRAATSSVASSPASTPTVPTTVAPYGSAPATAQVAQASPTANTVASAAPTATTTASSGLTADARSAVTAPTTPVAATDSAPAYAATAPTAATASAATTATVATTATSATAGAAASQPLALSQYPVPSRNDRSGVLNWASDSPPTGRELDRLIAEARHRKVGWVTFVANPDRLEEYGKLADRLARNGIQPIARVEDPYGDLPVEDVTALVKELRGHGVRYFQLFDGANVASETPDDRVDVRDYAERWLTAAKAVVAGGGLPGVGALAPDGDYDDLGFLRHVLSAVKERGGADVLGQSWLALRGETAGAAATRDTTADLADRASWFDRVSRQALGRSLPILATQDPASQPERLSADPAKVTPSSQVDQSEQSLRRHRRSQPALFAASRGTFAPA